MTRLCLPFRGPHAGVVDILRAKRAEFQQLGVGFVVHTVRCRVSRAPIHIKHTPVTYAGWLVSSDLLSGYDEGQVRPVCVRAAVWPGLKCRRLRLPQGL